MMSVGLDKMHEECEEDDDTLFVAMAAISLNLTVNTITTTKTGIVGDLLVADADADYDDDYDDDDFYDAERCVYCL